MKSIRHIFTLFTKDLLLEIRQQYSFYGVVLYVAATIFVLYMAVETPETAVWNALFWVIQLFISVNAVAKSFLQESRGRMLYFYTIAGARDFILAKMLFNSVLMWLMSLLSLLLFSLFFSYPIQRTGVFVCIVLLGSWSLGLVFTFLAAIAAKAQQNAAIMAILGFPLIIPQLLLLMRLSNATFNAQPVPLVTVLLLVALDTMVILLAVILFPFLWKD